MIRKGEILRRAGDGRRPSSTASQAKPYGWDLPSIEVLVAFLVGSSKVTLTVDGNVLKRSEVAATLRNTQKQSARRGRSSRRPSTQRKVAGVPSSSAPTSSTKARYARRTLWNSPDTARTSSRASVDELERKATVTGLEVPLRGSASSALLVGPSVDPGRRQARRLVPACRLQHRRRTARQPRRASSTRSRGFAQRRAASVDLRRAQSELLVPPIAATSSYLPIEGSDEAVKNAARRPQRFPRATR